MCASVVRTSGRQGQSLFVAEHAVGVVGRFDRAQPLDVAAPVGRFQCGMPALGTLTYAPLAKGGNASPNSAIQALARRRSGSADAGVPPRWPHAAPGSA